MINRCLIQVYSYSCWLNASGWSSWLRLNCSKRTFGTQNLSCRTPTESSQKIIVETRQSMVLLTQVHCITVWENQLNPQLMLWTNLCNSRGPIISPFVHDPCSALLTLLRACTQVIIDVADVYLLTARSMRFEPLIVQCILVRDGYH